MARFLPKGKFVTLMPPDSKTHLDVLTTRKKATSYINKAKSFRTDVTYKAVRDPPPTYKSNGTTFIWSSKSDSYRRKAKRKQKGRK